jgi:hypothetical protein
MSILVHMPPRHDVYDVVTLEQQDVDTDDDQGDEMSKRLIGK